MKKQVYSIEFKERKLEFFEAMKEFLSRPSDKYEKLVYSHIWLSSFYFGFCNDPLRTFAIVLQVSTFNVSMAIKKLIDKECITKKPYMIISKDKGDL